MAFPRALHGTLALLLLFTPPLLVGAADDGDARYEQALLWRIERDGIDPSHLLGTMHSDDPRVLALSPQRVAALDSAQRFAMEAVMDASSSAAIQRAMRLPEGARLPQLLGATQWRRLSDALKARGLPAEALAELRPWAVAVILSMPPLRGAVLDQQLAERARQRGLAVHGLESVAEQIAVFEGLSGTQQIDYLDDMLALVESGRMADYLERMTERYAAADLAGLVDLVERMDAESDDPQLVEQITERLIDARNRHMAERLQPLLERGGTFAAIGALHLPRAGGVLERLAAAGWRLVPITE